jgi:hypothetical protein
MLKRFTFVTALVGAAFALAAAPAQAALITGSFSTSSGGVGTFLPVNGQTGASTSLGTATGLDFTTTGLSTPGTAGAFVIGVGSTGDFAGLGNTNGTINDFTFTGTGSANYPTLSIPGFETFSGFTFDLTSIGVTSQTDATLDLLGSGIFHHAGFTDTPGTFVFTGNSQGGTFSFSASQTAVPEPASMMLLGTGLFGLGASFRRRRAARKA